MKSAELLTVAIAVPLVVAMFAAEVAASRAPVQAPVARTEQTQSVSSSNFDEIVVSAPRTTKG